jgi:hypothetical protein
MLVLSTVVLTLAAAETTPAAADPIDAIIAIPTNYVGTANSSGGVGDVRASWQNTGGPITQIAVSAVAPPGQYFQASGAATIYVLAAGSNIWNVGAQPSIADSCDVNASGASIDCALLPILWPEGASIAIRFPTYVAPGTPLTGPTSVEPGTTMRLTSGLTSVNSNEATAIATVDSVVSSTAFPLTGVRYFTGTANPGTIASVLDATGTPLGRALTDNSGVWSLTLAPGYGIVRTTFTAVDGVESAGSSGYYNSYIFSISTPASAARWAGAVTVTGQGQPGSRVVVTDEAGRPRASTVINSSGGWLATVPAGMSLGAHELRVVNTISDGSVTSILLTGTVVATPPLPASTLALSVSRGEAFADGEDVLVIRLVVTDALGRPVVGRRVHFRAPDSLTLSASNAITDVDGVATTTVAAPRQTTAQTWATIDGKRAESSIIRFISHRRVASRE